MFWKERCSVAVVLTVVLVALVLGWWGSDDFVPFPKFLIEAHSSLSVNVYVVDQGRWVVRLRGWLVFKCVCG